MAYPYLSYWLLATACIFGVLQIAAAYAGIKGLSLFNRPIFGYVIGGALIVGVSFWFYSTAPMTVIDLWAGSRQFALFIAALPTALVINALLCFLVRLRTAKSEGQGIGLEALKETTQLRLIVSAVKRRVKR